MKFHQKAISCMVIFGLLLTLAGCGGGTAPTTPNPPVASGDESEPKSARDQVYDLITENPIAFNGIPPKTLEDRADIPKGLPKEPKENLTVGMIIGMLGSPFFNMLVDVVQEECDKYGYTLIVQNSNGSVETATQNMDAYIAQGVDMILANADAQAGAPTFKKAAEAGIPVVVTSAQVMGATSSAITDILGSDYKAGFYVGEYAAKNLYEEGKVYDIGFVLMRVGQGATESRGNGFLTGFLYGLREAAGDPYASKWEAMLDGYACWMQFIDEGKLSAPEKGLNLLGYGNGIDPTAPGGQLAANDLITAHQQMDILYVEADTMFGGVEVVLKQYNLVPGQDLQVVCAADGTKETMEAIKRGEILAVGNNSAAMNALGMMAAVRGIFAEGKDMNNISANTFTPTVAITKENVDEYYDPEKPLALGMAYDLQSVTDYNSSASETADPF